MPPGNGTNGNTTSPTVPPTAPASTPPSSPGPATTAAEALAALETLESLAATGLLVRATSMPKARGGGWRLELSEDDGDTWTSLEAAQPGHGRPAHAIQEADTRIQAWKANREESRHAEVSTYLSRGQLKPKTITIDVADDGTGKPGKIEVDGFSAQASDGTWLDGVDPIQAIDRAKARTAIPPRQS